MRMDQTGLQYGNTRRTMQGLAAPFGAPVMYLPDVSTPAVQPTVLMPVSGAPVPAAPVTPSPLPNTILGINSTYVLLGGVALVLLLVVGRH